jgi:hypothetical protein
MNFYDKQSSQNNSGGAKLSHEESQRRKLDLLGQDK